MCDIHAINCYCLRPVRFDHLDHLQFIFINRAQATRVSLLITFIYVADMYYNYVSIANIIVNLMQTVHCTGLFTSIIISIKLKMLSYCTYIYIYIYIYINN